MKIQKEDYCLFQVAETVLAESDQFHLIKQFPIAGQHEMSFGEHQNCLIIAANLAHPYRTTGHKQMPTNCVRSAADQNRHEQKTPMYFNLSHPLNGLW
jgi:hypothetical protein